MPAITRCQYPKSADTGVTEETRNKKSIEGSRGQTEISN
jgi:hypothetical protein